MHTTPPLLATIGAALTVCTLFTGCRDATSHQASTRTTSDTTPNADPTPNANPTTPPPADRWRYVLIEDQDRPVAGEFPGLVIDAIELITEDGTSHFATTVVDYNLGGGNALDPSQALGAPDFNCDANSGRFVALGGAEANGYIVVGFDTDDAPIDFGAGSTVIVHNLDRLCGNWWLESYTVSVSTHGFGFLQMGTASGAATIPVTADP